MSAALAFQGGTLVLYQVDQDVSVPAAFQWIKGRWRCPAHHYPTLIPWLREQGIRDQVHRWQRLPLKLYDTRQAHDYQYAALKAWEAADQRGSIVLPTGAGKTFVAIQAIYRLKRSALVIAPTIDLLHQWYARLVNAFQIEVGVYYGGEKSITPLTVTTYHSAGDLIAAQGNQFKLIIYDEVHHLPAPNWGETALMSPAPARMGLTATYPEAHEQENGRWRVDELIGPVVYQQPIDSLVGSRLAEYRTERLRIDLTRTERQQYDADYAIYTGYFRAHQLHRKHGPNWLLELMRQGAYDRDARRAYLARQRLVRLLAGAENKLAALDDLLREYAHEQALIFTESNDVVYQIARRHLLPALTYETKAAERKAILDAFQSGQYRALVTSKVLNEGVDVPEAKIAIVLGGSASAREYIQRLGRVLRKAGNRQAVLFEVIARKTLDEGKSQRRRRGAYR
ncbi:MAG: DEAD/DEAH box helicase [Anaerolineae bacterium]|nr:DEAD/DEAH box helicase [Anaerolineae bacterium]